MKLNSIKQLKGTIVLKTGLHIGSGDTEMHIGGTDSQVVKHPKTLQPYIPGSSLKGKIRSLLELYFGLTNFTLGKVFTSKYLKDIQDDKTKKDAVSLLQLFGDSAGADSGNVEIGQTRLSFSDCYVNDETKDYVLSEIKSENSINRRNSKAESPRFIERVPEGVKFDFVVSIKDFDGDGGNLLAAFYKGLKLLELDALGGSGSRGYGKIKFENLNLVGAGVSLPENLD
ncbi:MAG: type III-A CRISPR-associated RAMP protein Csm3 [Endomicrobia bacterium]|nr:type III-A CRISPR-associated RAMP protein Csm3 [Endomicrobiia bacterium]MCL2506288.1 type III-A CRISPR-associated RAMP protein Csm3 [Endomicrobiia bacterium]